METLPLPMMLLSVKGPGGYHQMDIMGEALDIPRQALVKLGTQEAELCVQEVDEIIGSICKVAIRFSNIAHNPITWTNSNRGLSR